MKNVSKNRFNLVFLLMIIEGECYLQCVQKKVLDNDVKSIASCIFNILQEEKVSKSTVVVVQNKIFISNEIADILVAKNVPIIETEEITFERHIDAYDGNILAIIAFEKCDEFTDFSFSNITRINIKYLVILNESKKACNDSLRKIKSKLDQENVDIIMKVENKFEFYTFMPAVDEKTCLLKDYNEPVHINTCENGKMDNRVAFPKKTVSDLKGCNFRIGLATLYPFAMYENKDLLKEYDPLPKVNGSDVAILNIIAEYLNANIKYHRIVRSEENPYLQMEFLKFLENGSLDALAGGLYRIYGDNVQYSGIYSRQSIIWVYFAEREPRSWSIFAKKVDGLYYFLLFYIVYCIVWNLCCYFDEEKLSISTTILNAWGALIGASSLQDARSIKQRIVNIFYLYLCIYLSFYISVQMYSFLTISNPPEILKTNEEIMKSGRTPYLKPVTKYFVQDTHYLRFANTSEDCSDFVDCEVKTLDNKGVTVVIDGLFYPFQLATAKDNEARILRVPENILTVYHEMIIRKGSPIVANFQKVIARLFEAGICEKLYIESIGISVVARADEANENMKHNSYSCETGCSITLTQAAGAFYVWIFGCCISCCVFAVEVLVRRQHTEISIE